MKDSIPQKELEKTWIKFKKSHSDQLRNKLATHYFSYVQKIAVKVSEKLNWQVQPDALTSFGVDGLYKAIDGFDLSQGIKFESYASKRIKGSMIDGLRREDLVPRSVRIASEQFHRSKERMQNQLGRRVSDTEFVNMVGMDETEYNKNFRKYNATTPTSLDHHIEDGFAEDIKQDSNENLIDSNVTCPDSNMRRREFFSKLMGLNFNKTEQKIIYLHYYEGFTMEKVAKAIGRSESRVSQLHKKILERLRDKVKRNPDYFSEDIVPFVSSSQEKGSIF